MSGFDRTNSYAVPVQSIDGASATSSYRVDGSAPKPSEVIQRCSKFVQQFRIGEAYIYRDRLRANINTKNYCLEILHDHLIEFDEDLANQVSNTPSDVLPLFEDALRGIARQMLNPFISRNESNPNSVFGQSSRDNLRDVPEIQVTLRSSARQLPLRNLDANMISKLVRIPGIVISASVLSSKASHLTAACKACRNITTVDVPGGFAGFTLPRKCLAPVVRGEKKDCPLDPYVVVHENSKFVDQQTIKLQEAPDAVPVGELPRHIILSVDRYLTGKVVPGSRVITMGIYSTFSNSKSGKAGAVALRTPYLRVVGLEIDQDGASGSKRTFTLEEEEEFSQMSRTPNLYERLANSIAPSIYGNPDIKKAVLCLLFGGSKKVLPDGMRLRGDINVLLLGDPGTAKSQLLKFVEKVSPIAVYTSGKGSSAAGLTASVQRDPQSREFYLEGGAMVLADGGVVCIDEFDKMRDEDRVAIHEAMEQQTISIAKAGITTILNSRTSVLAAANPVFGRYDDMKSAGDNIDFQTTILSRFDMIFVIKDEHDEARDKTIARHVMNLHLNRAVNDTVVGEIDIEKMKRYVAYCKTRCAPRLSEQAAEKLSSHFVQLRKQVQQVERDNDERSSIPITIRQLEAMVRISEAQAKITLSPQVSEDSVEEAIRLFRCSTMDAVQAGQVEGMTRKELQEEMNRVEADIRRRLPVGWSTSHQNLVKEFVHGKGYTAHALERTLLTLERKEVIRFSGQRKTIHRIGV